MRLVTGNSIRAFAISFLLMALWLDASSNTSRGADAPPSLGVTVNCCTLNKTTLLSTESAIATLTVTNSSSMAVRLETGDITFESRQAGQWQQSRYCNSFNCWRFFQQIDPGATKFVKITLPKCVVLSDPCVSDVVIKYDIKEGSQTQAHSAQLPEYRFVADPTATFDIPALRGNLPVIVTQGSATANEAPDSILVTITTKSPLPELANMLRDRGLVVDPPGKGEYFGWGTMVHASPQQPQSSHLISDLQAVEKRFKDQIYAMMWQPRLAPQINADNVSNSARSDADAQADDFAAVAKIGHARDWKVSSDEVTGTLAFWPCPGCAMSPIDFGSGYSNPVALQPESMPSFPSTVAIVSTVQQRYVGASAPRFDQNSQLDRLARAAFRPVCCVRTLPTAVTMAADRPELYTVGSASKEAASRLGLVVDLAALLAAKQSVFTLAQLVGVRPETYSLLIKYPSGDIQNVGIGITFSGGERQQWRNIKPDPAVRTYSTSDAKLGSDAPIGIPDGATSITEMATAEPMWTPSFLRLGVEVDSQETIDVRPHEVLARLRRYPGVLDVAVTTRDQGQGVRYELLLSVQHKDIVPGLINFVKKLYAQTTSVSTTFELEAYEPNCTHTEVRLVRAAIRQDWLNAQTDARRKGVRLRKLLLVAVSPESRDSCPPLARSIEPGGLEYQQVDKLPSRFGPVPIVEGATMVFRSLSAQGAQH